MESTSHVIDEIANIEGFGVFYASFKNALFEKEWGQIYNAISEKDRKYFDGVLDFVTYMGDKNRLWELSQFNELSSEITYDDIGVRQIEIYFEAQILPGPAQCYGSLEFSLENEKWTVSGLERLRLARVQFEY